MRSTMGCLCCATWAPRFWTHWMANRRSSFPDKLCVGQHGFTGKARFLGFQNGCIKRQKTGIFMNPPKNIPILNTTPYIYIYIYMLWGYYLVQVWPFWKLLSGPSLFFSKTPIAKKHYKNSGFSPFFWEKKLCTKKLEVIIWSKLAFFKMQSTWTR